MNNHSSNGNWKTGDAYEVFMGRWSRRIAEKFILWLDPEPQNSWLDVGCGTGALATAISSLSDPSLIVACDPSETFINHAENHIRDPRVRLMVAGTGGLPGIPGGFDWVVSGLVLNFLPDPQESVYEMCEHTRQGGTVAAYVWDYAGRMEYLRLFWDEAAAMDPEAIALDEGLRFPICQKDALVSVFHSAGMQDVQSTAIEISICFESFSDYWQPFLGGTGPAPLYAASLNPERRTGLRDRLENRITAGEKGAITLIARAWAVRGTVL